jgi:hypothetical protein
MQVFAKKLALAGLILVRAPGHLILDSGLLD